MTNTNQLELGLDNAQRLVNSLHHRRRRVNRAKWWFAQMRRAVDAACVWQPARAARPEQTWLPGQRLEIRLLPQHQVCE